MINVVVGPPVAGKSEYVKAHAADGNVVIDYDLIAKAMGSRVAHNSTGSVRIVALESRKTAIERTLRGLDDDAWIIHTNPQPDVIQAYVDKDAKFTLLDPGKNEVLRRARASGRPASTIDAIEAWYANPPAIPSTGKKDMGAIMQRAYSLLTIKNMDDEQRVITGMASTPTRTGNPCHDPATGEFCETGGGAGGADGSSGAANPPTGAADPSKPVDPGKASKILSKEEQESITYYQGEKGFEKINTSLRNGNPPGEHAKRLSSAIEKHRLIQDTIVYRGVGNTLSKQIADKWRDREPGHPPITFVDKGFVSTSQSKKVAESFSRNIITVKLPKGHNALPIVDRKMAHESEILLNRGSKFKVTNVRKTAAGYKRIDVEIMP